MPPGAPLPSAPGDPTVTPTVPTVPAPPAAAHPAVTDQPPAGPTVTARAAAGPASAAGPAIAEQSRSPAGTAGSGLAAPDPPVPPLPNNNPPAPPACPVPGAPSAPLAISGRPKQCLSRRVDYAQHVLFQSLQRRRVSRLGGGVRGRTGGQGLRELAMKRLRLRGQHLISLGVLINTAEMAADTSSAPAAKTPDVFAAAAALAALTAEPMRVTFPAAALTKSGVAMRYDTRFPA